MKAIVLAAVVLIVIVAASIFFVLPILSMPDLVITSVTSLPDDSGSCKFEATVKNIGNAVVKDIFYYGFAPDNTSICNSGGSVNLTDPEGNTVPIEPGRSYTFAFYPGGCPSKLNICVDCCASGEAGDLSGVIPESNENNNSFVYSANK